MAKKEKELVADIATPQESVQSAKYFRLVRTERNLYSVETVTIEGDKIVATDASEPSYLPIAFDKLRRRTGEAFFAAVQAEAK